MTVPKTGSSSPVSYNTWLGTPSGLETFDTSFFFVLKKSHAVGQYTRDMPRGNHRTEDSGCVLRVQCRENAYAKDGEAKIELYQTEFHFRQG